jgi:hypothetical protein
VCPLLGTFLKYPELCIVFLISVSLSTWNISTLVKGFWRVP